MARQVDVVDGAGGEAVVSRPAELIALRPAAPRPIERRRYDIKLRRLSVQSTERIAPSMVRLVLAGDMTGFESGCFDDHIKLLIPRPGETEIVFPKVTERGIDFGDGPAPVLRDYTPRAWDIAGGTLTVDFAIHETGPASDWAAAAQPGDAVGVGGPRGSLVISPDYAEHILIGDETALPAIARRIEDLPATARVRAIIEVARTGEEIAIAGEADADILWLDRGDEAPGSAVALSAALREMPIPIGTDLFAWVAGETNVAKALRRVLIEEKGLMKHQVKAHGYWRRGAVAVHDHIDED